MAYQAYTARHPEGHRELVLSGGGITARILPELGFNLYSLTHKGRELFMAKQASDAPSRSYGNPILFPSPNRVKDAAYLWRGEVIRQVKGDQAYDIHGVVWDEPFRTEAWVEGEAAFARGTLEFAPGRPCFEAFPFRCRLILCYTLDKSGLRLSFHLENLSDDALPFGAAIHPFFATTMGEENIRIAVRAGGYHEAENCFPTGRILPLDAAMMVDGEAHPLPDLALDTVCTGFAPPARVYYDSLGLEMAIDSSEAFQNVVVFTPHARPCFCIEPQTCSTNAHNLYAQGLKEESGLIILGGHDTWEAFIHFGFRSV